MNGRDGGAGRVPPPDGLFRREVLEKRSNRWLGELTLYHPVPVGITLSVATGAIVVTMLFLIVAVYTQRVRVEGVLVPKGGVVTVVSPNTGTVDYLNVEEGTVVSAGQAIALVLNPHRTRSGETAANVERSLISRREEINESIELSERAQLAQIQDFEIRSSAYANIISNLQQEEIVALERLDLADESSKKFSSLLAEQLVSETEAARYEGDVLARRSELVGVRRQILTAEQELASLRSERERSAAVFMSERSVMRGQLAALQQEEMENQSRAEAVAFAPVAGVVAAKLVEPGQNVAAAQAMIRIVPEESVLEAHLLVPSRVIGQIRTGQTVKLAYRAFPYQKFGLQDGVLSQISLVPVPSLNGEPEEMYRAIVEVNSQQIQSSDQHYALLAGMQLEADIMLERSALIRFISEPIRSLRKYFE